MFNRSTAKPLLITLAGLLVAGMYSGGAYADQAQDNAALKEQMRIMMQRIDDLTNQVATLKKAQAAPAPAPAAAAPASAPVAVAKESSEPKFDQFMKGFYGTLDVSFDDTSKGMDGKVAYHIQNGGTGPGLDYTNPKAGGAGPVGRVGYMPALSTNKSQIGYRGEHKLSDDVKFVYQVETALAITASPGLKTSQYQQSNVVNGAIGLGDTFVGFAGKDWGRVKFGTFYSPYKRSTDRLNPFSGMLGDYAVVMGNSGGDNRVEFGTRLDHSFAYESPTLGGMWSFDVLYSPGQNRTNNNVVQSSGSPDCNGGNQPGSGNLLLNCDDGGFDNAFSVDLKFEYQGFYATAAYEIHKNVNRNSDGIGANVPQYANLLGATGFTGAPGDGTCNDPSGLLDCGTYATLVGEFPNWASAGGGTPPYLTDIADETAFKIGAQYKFPFGLTVNGIWEQLKRNVPQVLEFQNERARNGSWFALTQEFTANDNLSVGWAHAGATPGDPGGQHNYNPLAAPDTADMYTAAWKHRVDKQLYWYVDWAVTLNHGNAHYDLGAGGRGLTTDCHDGTNAIIIDGTSAGNTTWGGCREEGLSIGLNYKF